MCSQQSNATTLDQQTQESKIKQDKKDMCSLVEMDWLPGLSTLHSSFQHPAEAGTWVNVTLCLSDVPSTRRDTLCTKYRWTCDFVISWSRARVYLRFCGLSAMKSVYFAIFNVFAWIPEWKKQIALNSDLWLHLYIVLVTWRGAVP